MRSFALLPLLVACGTESIGGSEEASLVRLMHVIEAVAFAAEVSGHGVLAAADPPTECPVVSGIQGFATLDYGEGCVPDSGLVLGPVAGSVRLDVGDQVTTDVDGLQAGGVPLDGELTARATPVSHVELGLKLDGVEDLDEVELDITLGLGQSPPLRVSGTAQLNAGGVGVPVTLADLMIPPSGCLAPEEGSATIEQGLTLVTFEFGADGMVHASTSRDAEGELDVCALAEALFADGP
jgi:hypothetical protein